MLKNHTIQYHLKVDLPSYFQIGENMKIHSKFSICDILVIYCYFFVSILFWVGKDCAWNHLNAIMWIIFFIPTFLIAFDFVIITLINRVIPNP